VKEHEKINYVEFPSRDIQQTKSFFAKVFSWTFQDFGPEYTAFSNEGIDGGFYHSELSSSSNNGSALIVFFSENLEATMKKVSDSGGIIIKDIFPFPGGRRFHFSEPSDNEFAVWSDREAG